MIISSNSITMTWITIFLNPVSRDLWWQWPRNQTKLYLAIWERRIFLKIIFQRHLSRWKDLRRLVNFPFRFLNRLSVSLHCSTYESKLQVLTVGVSVTFSVGQFIFPLWNLFWSLARRFLPLELYKWGKNILKLRFFSHLFKNPPFVLQSPVGSLRW